MKTRTFFLALATAVAIASGPQLAHACDGDACSFVLPTPGPSITNAHQTRAVVVGICPLRPPADCGPSPQFEELNIQPRSSKMVRHGLDAFALYYAKFIPDPPTPGPKPADKAPVDKAAGAKALAPVDKTLVDKVKVTNIGQVPLKVVILDMAKVDIGRTPNYATGSFDITLRNGVAMYHWEAFTPGAVEPCQVVHDETRSEINAQCQRPQPKPDAAHPVSADAASREIEEATKRIYGNWATAVAPLFTDKSRTLDDVNVRAARASALMRAQLQAIPCRDAVAAEVGTRANRAAAMKELEQNFTGYVFVIDCKSNKLDLLYDFQRIKRRGA